MTKPKSILLIDDDLMVRQALGQALAVENYHVVPAANHHGALREVGQRQIHIILLDLNPRSANGWETLRRLIVLQPHLPVVGMTARPGNASSNAHRVGVLLERPLNLPVLVHSIQPEHRSGSLCKNSLPRGKREVASILPPSTRVYASALYSMNPRFGTIGTTVANRRESTRFG